MTTDEMLYQMTSLLFFGGEWNARPRGGKLFYKGRTPREAMINALAALPERDTAQRPARRRARWD